MKKGIRGLFLVLLFLFSAKTFAQEREVTGKIVDESGMSVPGVSIYLKSQPTIGTSSDFDGNFKLVVPGNDNVLVFSYVGFQKQEIAVGNKSNINVVLGSDVQSLSEVVVVGYGVQKRENLTGAVSTVNTEVLEARPITDVARGLQGTTPGLTITAPSGQIGENPLIKLRGNVGTLGTSGGAEPLILVDNVEVPNLNMVNPQDIENISVLKDAASTSIYGARGTWGVILITTKRGKRNTAPSVSYSNNFSWQTPTTMPEVAPAVEGAEMALAAVRRRIPDLPSFGVVGMYFDDLGVEKMREWESQYGGQDLGPEMVMGRDFEVRDGRLFFYRPWDAMDLFVKKWTPQQKHDISVSGGSENTNYYLGLGYLEQVGVLKTNPDQYERYNVNLSVNTSITDWFSTRANILYNSSNTTQPFYFSSNTYDPWYYVTRWPATYPYGTYEGLPFRNHISEVEQSNMNEYTKNMTRISLGATINPIENLKIDVDYTHDRNENHDYRVGGTLSAYNFWSTGANLKYEPYSSSAYDRVQYDSSWSSRNTAKAFATYDKDLGEDHNFKVIAGGDFEEYEYWFHSSQRRDLIDPDKGELDLATGDQYVNGSRDKFRNLGFFGRVNYAFRDKFLLELNGRYDGASRLSADEKWAFFPSFSAGYILTREDYMDFAKPYVSFLKVRGSWGSLGNPNASLSSIYRIMSPTTSGWVIDGNNQVTVGTPPAPPQSLTWETVTTLDIGVDARFFDNRFGINFDWYERVVSDMHSAGTTLPSSFGTGAPRRNFGELTTKGWELAADFKHTFNNGLNLNVAGTLTDYQEKISKFSADTKRIYNNYEGKVLGEIWGYETDRLFQADDFNADGSLKSGIASQELYENSWFQYGPGDVKYQDINGDGVIDYGTETVGDSGDMKVIGNETPRFQYGMRAAADWKGFDLSIFFQGVGKRDIWANGPVVIPGYRYAEGWFSHQLDYWSPENTGAFYPRPTDQSQSNTIRNFMPQTRYLQDMSYLRLKNLTVGYSLPTNLIEQIGVNKFRIYFSGENLVEWSNLEIPIDPEVDYTTAGLNDPNSFGRVYPFRRNLSFGVQVSL